MLKFFLTKTAALESEFERSFKLLVASHVSTLTSKKPFRLVDAHVIR